ncbi:hypothetical protein RND81_14G243400 [Saponaria officinalis]|uniref:UDENN domain-containing protein n=2 Tax=Saponaria officinalis TaxID=3572 RepID=A0AAW1GU86_SAPOF
MEIPKSLSIPKNPRSQFHHPNNVTRNHHRRRWRKRRRSRLRKTPRRRFRVLHANLLHHPRQKLEEIHRRRRPLLPRRWYEHLPPPRAHLLRLHAPPFRPRSSRQKRLSRRRRSPSSWEEFDLLVKNDKPKDNSFEGSRTDYIAKVLSKSKTLYFAAYNERRHWVLAAVHTIKRVVFWMDPRHGDVRESFKKMITEAFQKRDSVNPLLMNEVNKKIDYSLIKDSDEHSFDVSDGRSNGFGRHHENGGSSPEVTLSSHSNNLKLERSNSSHSLYSSVRSMDEDYDDFSNQESDCSGDFMTTEWAKENKNDLLQIVCAYGATPIPARGSEMVFKPLEHFQPIQYKRPSVSDLGVVKSSIDTEELDPIKIAEVNARLAAAEEAIALSVWTTATLCRVLSLDSILALLTGVMLEKQVIVVCPNMGILSTVVLSLIPMIRPFEWHSLHLPILPVKMIDFLNAPLPYIVSLAVCRLYDFC